MSEAYEIQSFFMSPKKSSSRGKSLVTKVFQCPKIFGIQFCDVQYSI